GGNGGPAAAAGEGKDPRRHPGAARIVALQHEDSASAVGTSPGGEIVSLAGGDRHRLAGRLPGASGYELQRVVAGMAIGGIAVDRRLTCGSPTGHPCFEPAVGKHVVECRE